MYTYTVTVIIGPVAEEI